jgi:ATP-dependent protease ClpP protease subunit
VFVHGEIDRQLVQRLTPDVIRLQNESRDPITAYIDSEGGKVFYAESLLHLLEASDQDGAAACRIITVATGLAASAAADLLCSGGYAIAHARCTIFFHGVRRSGEEITVAVASNIAESLRRTNERYAIALADKSVRRLGFRYAWMRGQFDAYRTRVSKQHSDLECFIGLLLERLSTGGVEVVEQARERNERYESLVDHVLRAVNRNRALKKPGKRTADTEAVILKSIIDFEKSKNKEKNWTYARKGLRQATNDFLLVREYLNNYDGDPLTRLCDNWGVHFLARAELDELAAIQDQEERTAKMYEKVKPLVRPLWLFLVALCHCLQDEDHELSATDACWLGLIDEVIGGPEELCPFRLLMESVPDPAQAPPNNP